MKQTNSALKTSFMFVFLSLFVILLCFFAYLISQSSFDKTRVNATKISLAETFQSKTSDDFIQITTSEYFFNPKTKQQVESLFPKAKISFNQTSNTLKLTFEKKEFSSTDILNAGHFLNAQYPNKKMFILISTEKNTETFYPVYENKSTDTAGMILNTIKQNNLSSDNIIIGLKNDGKDYIDIIFDGGGS